MRHFLTRLAVGLATFFVGVCLSTLFVGTPHSVTATAPLPVLEAPKAETPTSQTVTEICFRQLWNNKEISDEKKAVIAAQAFVTLESYTNGILGSCNMALPCVEGRGEGEGEGVLGIGLTLSNGVPTASHLSGGAATRAGRWSSGTRNGW